jgi:hypothetical protein
MKTNKKIFSNIQNVFFVLLKFLNTYHKNTNVVLTIKVLDKNIGDNVKPALIGYFNYDGRNNTTTTINWAGN